jgi:hypothetical protein
MSDGGGGDGGATAIAEVPSAPRNQRKGPSDDDFGALNKSLRACRSCRLVKGYHQVRSGGGFLSPGRSTRRRRRRR